MLTAAFNGAGANLQAEGAKVIIAHTLLFVAEVGDGLLNGGFGGMGIEDAPDVEELALPETVELLLDPLFGEISAFGPPRPPAVRLFPLRRLTPLSFR